MHNRRCLHNTCVYIIAQNGATGWSAVDRYGRTPLMYAIIFDNYEAAKVLLRRSTDSVSLTDIANRSALVRGPMHG